MTDIDRSIFRVDAVRHYAASKEKAVLPRIVAPGTMIYLWILIGLLLCAGIITWNTQVPVYASGSAVIVTERDEKSPVAQDNTFFLVSVPPEYLSRLHAGQRLFLRSGSTNVMASRPIVAVEPEISSPDALQRRFNLSAGAASAITRPSAVAIASLEPPPSGLPVSTYTGSVYEADVEIGTRRAISFLPLVNRFF